MVASTFFISFLYRLNVKVQEPKFVSTVTSCISVQRNLRLIQPLYSNSIGNGLALLKLSLEHFPLLTVMLFMLILSARDVTVTTESVWNKPPLNDWYSTFTGGPVSDALPHPVKNGNKAKTKNFSFYLLFVKIYKIIDYRYSNYSLNIILVHIIS